MRKPARVSVLSINLSDVIEGLIQDVKTPHFMQMHAGGLDVKELEFFTDSQSAMERFQVMTSVNVADWDVLVEQHGVPTTGFAA